MSSLSSQKLYRSIDALQTAKDIAASYQNSAIVVNAVFLDLLVSLCLIVFFLFTNTTTNEDNGQ